MHVDNLPFQLVDDMHSMWNADSFLDQAQELVKKAFDEHAKYKQVVSSKSKTRRRCVKSEWTKRESSRRKV